MSAANENAEKKIILAYSGGLDTSVILVWLKEMGRGMHTWLIMLDIK